MPEPADILSFGETLQSFRKQRHLSQQQLADALGVHRHAIGRWERGDFLPRSRGIVLELASCLRLSEAETRQLLEASLTAVSPHWHVPFQRNPFFTGREEILRRLHGHLTGDQQAGAPSQAYALYGLGGIGKTQIALEYAYRHALEYSAVFWIEAETVETLVSSLLRIAEVLGLPEREESDQLRVIAAIQRWLTTHSQWLLIWDNVEDFDLLPRFLPAVRQGAILVTTRSQALGTLAEGLGLAPLESEEGLLLVLRRAKVLEPEATQEHLQRFVTRMPTDYLAASELVSAMGGLPLALDQAGAYIEETGCSTSDYLHRYEQMRSHLLDRRGVVVGEHPYSVTTTFCLASEQVERQNAIAADLLQACSFLHADGIPEELFGAGAIHLGPVLEPLAANPSDFDLAMVTLRSLSLVQRHPETHMLSMHRLVQTVLRERMSDQLQMLWLRRVSAALNAVFPEVTHEVWSQCERLLPHVLACASAVPDSSADLVLARLLQKAASYLDTRAQFEQAEALYRRALRIQEQIPEAEYPDLSGSLTGLAYLYAQQGKLDQAEPHYQRALAILERALGPDDSELASMYHKLAVFYGEQGKNTLAEDLFRRALHILERAPEPARHKMANSLNGLATVYVKQEKYADAEPLFRQALSVWEEALGPEHPMLTYGLNGLAVVYSTQRRYEEADLVYRRALAISERTFGPEHPQVGFLLANQAECYAEQGEYHEAESLYNRARSIWEQAYGPEHPRVAYVLTHEAGCYLQEEKYAEAEALYLRALSIQEQQLSQAHPDTAQTLLDLATCYQKQQNVPAALAFAERARQSFSQSLGDADPKTAAARALHAELLEEQSGTGG